MLVRADPVTKTISLLSFPRDLGVPIYCGASHRTRSATSSPPDRINSAYSRCGAEGTCSTIKHLTGLPINYLITVNFHGFKEIVDKLGGVWLDVDRRYYNMNTGTAPRTTRTSTSSRLPAATASRRSTSSASATPTTTLPASRASRSSCARSRSSSRRTSRSPSSRASSARSRTTSRSAKADTRCRATRCSPTRSSRSASRRPLLPGQDPERAVPATRARRARSDIQTAVDQFTHPDVAVVEGGERRRARHEAEAEGDGAAAVQDDGARAERQRRRRRGRERVVPARASTAT